VRPVAAHLLRSWVRIPPGAWIFVCCECRALSGRGLCDDLITRSEESYRLCCVIVCDLETSRIGAPYIYDISNLRVKKEACRWLNSPSHSNPRSAMDHPLSNGLLPRRTGFYSRLVYVGFIVDKVVQREVLHQVLLFLLLDIINIIILNNHSTIIDGI